MKIKLVLIFLLALFLRLYQLDKFPAGFNLDEISQGYTAYSILKTGKDEWGVRFPLAPRAFGDFRSPLYTYLTIPSIFLFGLTETAVRLPSAIFGCLAVLGLFLLVSELFKEGLEFGSSHVSAKNLALLSSLFLAINPWHISLSRGAFEASLNIFLLPLGIWFFLKGLKNWKFYIPSALIFGINLFSYYSPRFFTPLVIAVLIFYFKKSFFEKKRYFVFLAVFGIFLLLSLQTLLIGGKTRLGDTSVLNPTDHWMTVADRQYEAAWFHQPLFLVRIFSNKLTAVSSQIYKQYLNYFSFEFLFSYGAGEGTYGMIPGRGVLYLYELPLLVLMLWLTVKKKDKRWLLILAFLILSPIPASLAKGNRAANRAATMLPFLQILSAGGVFFMASIIKDKIKKPLFVFFSVMIGLFFLFFFLDDYFYHAPRMNASSMAYGWREVGNYLEQNGNKFETIMVSGNLSEPQIAIPFFLKINPEIVQKESPKWLAYEKEGFLFVDQLPDYSLGKYRFRNFKFPEDQSLKSTLFIGKDEDFWGIEGIKTEEIIYFPGPKKSVAFKIITF